MLAGAALKDVGFDQVAITTEVIEGMCRRKHMLLVYLMWVRTS